MDCIKKGKKVWIAILMQLFGLSRTSVIADDPTIERKIWRRSGIPLCSFRGFGQKLEKILRITLFIPFCFLFNQSFLEKFFIL